MSLLKFLGLGSANHDPQLRSRLAVAVHERLQYLPHERARFVAAFAGLLMRVAYADRQISQAEGVTLRRLLAAQAGLSADEARTVADIATRQATSSDGIDYALLTRAFNEVASDTEKERLIDCLYAIATAEGSVSVAEDEEIRAVSHALLLSHEQFIAIRHRYKEQLAVIQAARRLRR